MRCSELEQECAKCKQENQEMRELIASSSDTFNNEKGASLLAQQCAQMQIELDRYREERSNLKTIVLSQESNIRDARFDEALYLFHLILISVFFSAENDVISAFKAIIKQLETELEQTKEMFNQTKYFLGSSQSVLIFCHCFQRRNEFTEKR